MTTGAGTVAAGWRGGLGDGLRYGMLGLPLAFVALPLYVVLPHHYAAAFGVPLATLGALLLAARLFDAVADPWIGRLVDLGLAGSRRHLLAGMVLASAALALGFRGLFIPPMSGGAALLAWAAAMLLLTYLAYSVLSVLHQAWGARLGGSEAQRARIVSWREGLALLGVMVASVLPSVAGLDVTTAVFAAALAAGVALLAVAPRPQPGAPQASLPMSLPLRTPAFRRLLAIYLVNGIASAVPATLVLFFVRDRLQLPDWEPAFLAAYFAAGALSLPLWMHVVARWGLARAWLAGMVLAIAAFVWAATLGAGDSVAFFAVCAATGVALGADLALPSALLAGVVQRSGHQGRLEGAYFGWWNFATKLNLALAAGIALPLLAAFGYTPGSQDAGALQALTLAYCALPCALKALAAALLWWRWICHPDSLSEEPSP
ncbi:MAG: MFS transporter [Burkholderiaceae bacterium]|nr:MFS transporter [Burkholderiaceae bacterium]